MKTRTMILCALFAALTAVGAFFKIPFALAAISLQFLFTAMAGVLLGAGGLVRAYSHGASIALEAAGIVTMRECVMASLSCDYNQYGRLQALIPECGGTVDDTVFGERVTMYFHLTDADLGRMRPKLADATCGSVEVQEEGKKFFQVL